MNTQNIVHDIALCWKNTSRDVRPYARFDEYFLSPYKTADFHNHIHIYYHSKTFNPRKSFTAASSSCGVQSSSLSCQS